MRPAAAPARLLAGRASWPPRPRVDQRRPAEPDGLVEIENPAGSIHVMGWDKNEVRSRARLGSRRRGARVLGRRQPHHASRWRPRATPTASSPTSRSRCPRAAACEIEGFAATHPVERGERARDGGDGERHHHHDGGGSKDVDLQSVNGSVEVTSPAGRVKAEAVNGSVTVREAERRGRRLHRERRPAVVTGGTFSGRAWRPSTAASCFEGGLGKSAALEAETVSGAVELVLPANVAADFSISTFSGDIENELGPAAAARPAAGRPRRS